MKKLLVLATLLLCLSSANNAQFDPSRTKMDIGDRLMLKSKNQKTAAWTLLSAGIALDVIAVAVFPKDYDILGGNTSKEDRQLEASFILFSVGTAAALTSIPFFIVSGVNKRKARLLINTERVNISPKIPTSEWQLKTGIAINF